MTWSGLDHDLLMTCSWLVPYLLWLAHDFLLIYHDFLWLSYDSMTDLLTDKETNLLTDCNCLESLQLSWHSTTVLRLFNCLNRPWFVPYQHLFVFIWGRRWTVKFSLWIRPTPSLALGPLFSSWMEFAIHWNPRNHPKLLSQKSWHLGIQNGPIARGFWNLNQSIEQKVKTCNWKSVDI